MEKEELKDLLEQEFFLAGDFDVLERELYIEYFNTLIDSSSGKFLSGPINLRKWILEIKSKTEIITYKNKEYYEIKDMWRNNKLESKQFTILANYKYALFLIERH